MKHLWINSENSPQLLVFFNGWGMDEKPFSHLSPDGLDVLMFYDYTSPGAGVKMNELCEKYELAFLAAWSLGAWAAAEFLSRGEIGFACSAAINGTLAPIHALHGISPDIFAGTIDSWSAAARKKFNRRMCGTRETFDFFERSEPRRSIKDQKAELVAMRRRIERTSPGDLENMFNVAIVAENDRIFPPEAQENFWRGAGTEIKKIPAGHYCFDTMTSWREVATIGQA